MGKKINSGLSIDLSQLFLPTFLRLYPSNTKSSSLNVVSSEKAITSADNIETRVLNIYKTRTKNGDFYVFFFSNPGKEEFPNKDLADLDKKLLTHTEKKAKELITKIKK